MKSTKITRMRYERLKNGWTLNYVANQIGISNQAISKIELQQTKNPSYTVIVKIENLFGLSHRELFSLVDDYNIDWLRNKDKTGGIIKMEKRNQSYNIEDLVEKMDKKKLNK